MDKTDPQATGPIANQAGPEAFRTALERAGDKVLAEHTRLEGCEIIGLIGAGDFSIVYLAYDYALARQIAVKEYMPAGMATHGPNGRIAVVAQSDEELYRLGLRSFLSEARLLARFNTPSLVKIQRFWEANNTAYLAMPYYEGFTLQDAVSSGRFDANEKRVRMVLEQLFAAVDLLHRAHCYHPDIAPANIRILPDGRPLLLDFGAARRAIKAHTEGPAAALRPGYAPLEDYEEIPNLKRGPWTDVYALGAVAYFMMSGHAPPPAVARMASDRMTPARQAGAARYGDAFLAALDKALAVMPQQRYQSVPEFRRALGMPATSATQVHDGDTSTVRWPGPDAARPAQAHAGAGMGGWQNGRRSGVRTAVLALGIFAIVAVAGFWGIHRTDPSAGSADPSVAVAGKTAELPGAAATPTPAPAPTSPAPSVERSAAPPVAAATTTAPTPEDKRWQVASSLNNASAYENYLAEYPNGRYAAVARAALESLRSSSGAETGLSVADPAQQEEALWNAVRKIDKPLAYESFLRRYPSGRYASAARNSLARLRPPLSDPRLTFDPPVVDATRRPFGASPSNTQPVDRPAAVTPATPVAPQASPDRLAAIRPPDTPAAARSPQAAAEPAVEPEAEQDSAPLSSRTGRTLRLANQTMTGNFSGDPVSGLVSGNGRIVWDNGDQFEGTMVRGQKEGRGEFRWANGQRYRGDWSRDQPNGKGTIQFPNGDRYTGDMRNGLPNGTGTLVFANGNRYQGDVRDGQPNGSGVLTFSNGNRYRGEVRDGLPNGAGTNRYANGDTYSGSWRRGRSDGQGRYTWANGNYWEGEFRDDVKTANGRMVIAGDTSANAPTATSGTSTRGNTAGGSADLEPEASGPAR